MLSNIFILYLTVMLSKKFIKNYFKKVADKEVM